jgi:hypothetical protein
LYDDEAVEMVFSDERRLGQEEDDFKENQFAV